MDLKLPKGWVAVPKGGRPSKIARDMAVLLALRWRERSLGEKRWQAMDWAVQQWPALHDAAGVRASCRKARKLLPAVPIYLDLLQGGGVICASLFALTPPGTPAWFWAVDEPQARQFTTGASTQRIEHVSSVDDTGPSST